MKEPDIIRIEQALQSEYSASEINSVCRDIIKGYLKTAPIKDRGLESKLVRLIDNLDFYCDNHVKKQIISSLAVIRFVEWLKKVLGTVGLRVFAYILCFIPIFSIIGVYLLVYLKKTCKNINATAEQHRAINDLSQKVDYVGQAVKKIVAHNQLEGCYCGILRWLQYEYTITKDKELKESIQNLMLDYDYEFVDFDPNLTDCFEQNADIGISKLTMIRPAIRNKRTGEIPVKGHVVYPKL